jgi:hypothetical protein
MNLSVEITFATFSSIKVHTLIVIFTLLVWEIKLGMMHAVLFPAECVQWKQESTGMLCILKHCLLLQHKINIAHIKMKSNSSKNSSRIPLYVSVRVTSPAVTDNRILQFQFIQWKGRR